MRKLGVALPHAVTNEMESEDACVAFREQTSFPRESLCGLTFCGNTETQPPSTRVHEKGMNSCLSQAAVDAHRKEEENRKAKIKFLDSLI